ncbi:MAG: hypothetical protein ACMXYE_05620 [Candidatus Woesearchaeota archaeon]
MTIRVIDPVKFTFRMLQLLVSTIIVIVLTWLLVQAYHSVEQREYVGEMRIQYDPWLPANVQSEIITHTQHPELSFSDIKSVFLSELQHTINHEKRAHYNLILARLSEDKDIKQYYYQRSCREMYLHQPITYAEHALRYEFKAVLNCQNAQNAWIVQAQEMWNSAENNKRSNFWESILEKEAINDIPSAPQIINEEQSVGLYIDSNHSGQIILHNAETQSWNTNNETIPLNRVMHPTTLFLSEKTAILQTAYTLITIQQ